MRILWIPAGLRGASLYLLLTIPLAALQTVIMMRAPWWNLPVDLIKIWCTAVALIVVPLSVWAASGRKWALYLAGGFSLLWCVSSILMTIVDRNFWLAVFTVSLILYWISCLSWLRFELGRSFLDSRMKWYQGVPQPIHRLSCAVNSQQFQVSRFDRYGAYLFDKQNRLAEEVLKDVGKKDSVDLVFEFRGKKLACLGKPSSILENGRGFGVRFEGLGLDERKELGDFVESLVGEGYAT